MTISVIMFIFLSYFYSPILFSPNSYLFGSSGDGAKNYFCYEWHVKNDDSFVNYTGTNYPFGEQHIFTDGNPLLSNLVKALPFLKDYSIAIFNLSLLFSIVVTTLLLFSILKILNVQNWMAILGALGIAILNPQTNRLGGHFNLAYSFFIPLVIYLLLKFEATDRKMKYSLLVSSVLIIAFFIHPYMGMILTAITFLYHVIKLIFVNRVGKHTITAFIFQGLLPVAIYFLFVKLTDTHSDRTSHPYGFLFFTSRIETIFVSSLPPLRHMISLVIKVYEQNWEGLAYVGVTTLLMMLYLPYFIFRRRKYLGAVIKQDAKLGTLIILSFVSVLLLIFSMGLPFKYWGSWMLDSIPLIQQFRSPGRFAWVFYYVATITSVVMLSKYFLVKANVYSRNLLITALLLLFTVEGVPFHSQYKQWGFTANYFNKEKQNNEMKQIASAITSVKPKAIIPLPFFHLGTDYFVIPGTEKIKTASFIAALNTNVPIMGNCTDRTSLSEAKVEIQLMGGSLISKDFVNYTKPGEKFCLLYSKEALTEGEKQILAKGKTLIETENFIVCEILSSDLVRDDISEYSKYYNDNKGLLINMNGCLVKDSCYVNSVSFVNNKTSYTAKANEQVMLFRILPNSLQSGKEYEVSFWCDLSGGDELGNNLEVQEMSSTRNEVIKLTDIKFSGMTGIVGGKVLVKGVFSPKDKGDEVRIGLSGCLDCKGVLVVSDMLIRPLDKDVYQLKKRSESNTNSVWVNNCELK